MPTSQPSEGSRARRGTQPRQFACSGPCFDRPLVQTSARLQAHSASPPTVYSRVVPGAMAAAIHAGCLGPNELSLAVDVFEHPNRRSTKRLTVPVPRGRPDLSCWDALVPEVLRALNYKSLDEAQKDFAFWSSTSVSANRLRHGSVFAELNGKGQIARVLVDHDRGSPWYVHTIIHNLQPSDVSVRCLLLTVCVCVRACVWVCVHTYRRSHYRLVLFLPCVHSDKHSAEDMAVCNALRKQHKLPAYSVRVDLYPKLSSAVKVKVGELCVCVCVCVWELCFSLSITARAHTHTHTHTQLTHLDFQCAYDTDICHF